ncbi:MAG: hypothetical protein OSB38_18700 [Paraburkholderia fungorum]|nr:hypothetical protein [Paraburkholderia fungorum]
MQLINVDLRHVRTNVRLSRAEIVEAQWNSLCTRTAQRQRAAKAALARRGVAPRVHIGALYVAPHIAKHYQHSDNVGGVR